MLRSAIEHCLPTDLVIQRTVQELCPGPRLQDFAGKLGSLRKALKSRAELIFIDAPHLVDADESISEPFVGEPRAWWTWQASSLVLHSDRISYVMSASKQCKQTFIMGLNTSMHVPGCAVVCPTSWTSVTRILMWQAAPRWRQHILV